MMIAGDTTLEAPFPPEDALALLRKQASLYARLESYAVRQRSLITGDDAGPLLSLLADRQKLSEELTRIAIVLSPVRREWSVYRERFSRAQRTEAEQLVSEIQERLRGVIESDEQDARVLATRKQAVVRSLRETHTTRQAISAYRAPSGRSARLDCMDGAS